MPNEVTMLHEHIEARKEGPPEHLKAQVTSLNETGFELMKAIAAEQDDGNITFFPSSVHPVIAQLVAGARGKTARELIALTGVLQTEAFQTAYASFLNELRQNTEFELVIANSLWVQIGFSVEDDFLAVCESYGALIQGIDFNNPTAAADAINKWCEEHTRSHIKDAAKPDLFNALTRMVIANAVYFKGRWLVEFDPKLTEPLQFEIDYDPEKRVPTMTREGYFRTCSGEHYRALELPMKGGATMLVVVPEGSYTANDVVVELSVAMLAEIDDQLNAAVPNEITVYLPKFEIRSDIDLCDACMEIGVQDLFAEGQADLTGINSNGGLFVSNFFQKAWLKVNEEGAEGAAVTMAVVGLECARMPVEFRVDRSFVALVRDRTGAVIAMARVTDPSEAPK